MPGGIARRAVFRDGRGCTLTYRDIAAPEALAPLPHIDAQGAHARLPPPGRAPAPATTDDAHNFITLYINNFIFSPLALMHGCVTGPYSVSFSTAIASWSDPRTLPVLNTCLTTFLQSIGRAHD